MSEIPLHPMLVHFPIALFITAFGLEILSWIFKKDSLHQAAVIVYVLAAISTPVTAWTGLQEQWEDHLHHPVVYLHRNLALLTAGTSLISLPILWLSKKSQKKFRAIFAICVFLTMTFVSLAGYNGGRLVYEYSIGVEEK